MRKFKSSARTTPEMEWIIESHVVGLGGVGIIGGLVGPGADVPFIIGLWTKMTLELAAEAGHALNSQTGKKIALVVLKGIGSVIAGMKLASTIFSWIAAPLTLGGSLAANMAANAALNVVFTYAYGRAVARYFLMTDDINSTKIMARVIMRFVGADLKIFVSDEVIDKAIANR